MKPKAEYFDQLVDRNLLTSFRITAKEFGIKESEFIKWLLENKYIFRDQNKKLNPYAKWKEQGLFEIKEYKSRHSKHAGTQTLVQRTSDLIIGGVFLKIKEEIIMTEIKKQEIQSEDQERNNSQEQKQEQANPLKIDFKKPYTFEGKVYNGIDLSGMEDMTGEEFRFIEKSLRLNKNMELNPETTTEGAFLYASKATDLPVEFFCALPLKEVVKIKRILIDFLWKLNTKTSNPLEIVFEKAHEYKGKTYEKVDLFGLESMTGQQLIDMEKLGTTGLPNINQEMTVEGAFLYASHAADLPIGFFYSLPIKEARKVKVAVINFLWL